MANGPPTPPPTTEVEIQDEARAIAENPPTAAIGLTSASASPDAFQEAFPAIIDLASHSNFHGLIKIAEATCLRSDSDSDHRMTRLLLVGPLILAYMIIDDLPPARFALTQLPESIASMPLSKSLAKLLTFTWDRQHANVYAQARALYEVVHEPGFFDEQLASILTGLITAFVESFRRRTFILLSTVYTSLPVSLAQMYLGMKEDELLAAAQGEGWFYESSTNVFIPQATKSTCISPPESGISVPTSLRSLK
ncbi:hypothetical protein H0H92_000094 [Tricholoma furcatifolium]|nr:hypothetical protein H0H92_000094 [Tricholoma furcatifolium]